MTDSQTIKKEAIEQISNELEAQPKQTNSTVEDASKERRAQGEKKLTTSVGPTTKKDS